MTNDDEPAPIPVIDPSNCDDFSVFRETFLSLITDKKTNAALRTLGEAQATAFYQYSVSFWPDHLEPHYCIDFRAVLADLRYLQGFLQVVTNTAWLDSDEGAFPYAQLADRISRQLGKLCEQIERRLPPAGSFASGAAHR